MARHSSRHLHQRHKPLHPQDPSFCRRRFYSPRRFSRASHGDLNPRTRTSLPTKTNVLTNLTERTTIFLHTHGRNPRHERRETTKRREAQVPWSNHHILEPKEMELQHRINCEKVTFTRHRQKLTIIRYPKNSTFQCHGQSKKIVTLTETMKCQLSTAQRRMTRMAIPRRNHFTTIQSLQPRYQTPSLHDSVSASTMQRSIHPPP